MASCQVFRDDNGEITRVEAPNGKESVLFNSILNEVGDKEVALRYWAKVYTPQFKEWFGDWEKLSRVKREDPGMDAVTLENLQKDVSKITDQNGEPQLVFHGSKAGTEFNTFRKRNIDNTLERGTASRGFYFTPQKELAAEYGPTSPLYLNIKDPWYPEEDWQRYAQKKRGDGNIFIFMEEYLPFEEFPVEIVAYDSNQIKSLYNIGSFDSRSDNIYLQQDQQSELPSNEEINKTIEGFLEKIGVSVHSVRNLKDAEGNVINAVAKADMLNKVIEVVEDKADITTLPEEAAHFFVEMMGENHPLFKQMMDKINNYKIYGETFEQYKKSPAYRNQDGTINIPKIKKEAIGKMIAFHIIGQQNGVETEAKLTSAMNWWEKVLEFIKSIFNRAQSNPFAEIATRIRKQDVTDLDEANLSEGEFYQNDEILRNLEDDQSRIQLDNSIDPVTQQKRHIYTYDGVPAKGSVTSVYVDAWLKKIFRSDNRSEKQKIIDLLKAEYGDKIHEEMQNILESWTNPDGTLREVQAPHAMVTSKGIYNKLNNYMQNLLNQYPEGTRFRAETKVYDKKTRIAGSIDFMAIMPDGTVDIMDWKSQEIGKNQTDIKSYKEPMYRIQLENYRKILELQYGFRKFGKIRAIPIRTSFIYNKGELANIQDIEIGDLNPALIPDDKSYLLPVTLRNESTGSEQLDELLERLNGIYDKISNTRYTKEELYKKREELGKLRAAMRDLQLRGKVDKLVELGLLEFNKYNEKLKAGTLTGRDIMEAQKILEVFNESGTFLYDMMQDLHKAAKDTEDPAALAAYNDIKDRFLSMTARTGKLISDIKRYRDQVAQDFAAANGVENLLDAEKPIGVLNGLFSSLSNITQKSFRAFSKMLRGVQNTRDAKFDQMTDKLKDLQKGFTDWATKKGLSTPKAMDMILGVDKDGNWNGNFLNVYKPEFYEKKREAIKKGNTKWLMENLVFDEERYKKQEAKQIEFFKSIQYSLDDKKNQEMINSKIKEWKLYNNIVGEKGGINQVALLNPSNTFLKANDTWYTEKWIELNKEENKPLKDVYDYFQSLIRQAEKLGMLDKFSPGFIPSIFATKVDQLVFGNVKDLFSGKGVFENLEVDSGSRYTPEVDPTDGSIINRLPVYFTRDIGEVREDGTMDYSKKSKDLFKVFAIWGAHMYNYEAMESIEDTAMVLLEAEKNKQSLVTDKFGNIIIENGKVKAVNNNDRNAKLLEDFVNYYLYDRVSGMGTDVKIKPFWSDKEYSVLKSVRSAMSFFSFKTLALNPISGTAQFVGGTGNALFMAQKGQFFTKKSWAKAMYLTVSDKKAQAALKYFNTHLEGNQNIGINELSLSSGNRIINMDNAYIIQRKSDAAVQNPIAVAMMLNHMIDDNGNIVDIQQYVKNKYNYNTEFYSLDAAGRREMKNKIDAEVKQLQDEKSLLAVGSVDEKGQFSLPGLDKSAKTIGDFRYKVKAVAKSIIGNSTRDDINHIRTTMLGMAFMQFRSWMPEMVEERLSGLKYDDELGVYTIGKLRLFAGEMFSKRFPVLLKSLVTGFGNDGIQAAKDKYNEMKRAAFEKGEAFDITEGEFIDLYIGNLRSEMLELLTIMGFAMSIFALGAAIDGDDDEETRGMKKYLNRALGKYYQEFAFYYNPVEFTNLVKAPLPVIGLAEDFFRFSAAFSKEIVGQAVSDEWSEEAKPSKYFFRMVPIAKEALLLMAAHDDEFRKEWGIKVQ